jgi:hypothetical protein
MEQKTRQRKLVDFSAFVMHLCYAIASRRLFYEENGRGGIRTHGGLPHARFRVECLKPDSATLPCRNKKTPNARLRQKASAWQASNVEHPTRLRKLLRRGQGSNATPSSRLGVRRWTLGVERLYLCNPPPVRPGRQDCLPHEAKKCYN